MGIRHSCSAFVVSSFHINSQTMPAALSTSFSARIRTAKSARSLVLFYQNATSSSSATGQVQLDATVQRFKREAAKKKEIDEECVLTIHGNQYNMTAWANAHPGT